MNVVYGSQIPLFLEMQNASESAVLKMNNLMNECACLQNHLNRFIGSTGSSSEVYVERGSLNWRAGGTVYIGTDQ